MNISGYRLILLSCFAVLAVSVSFTFISDYDFWWHLKLGESVFTTGKIYTADTFSYTVFGQTQFNGEWLADLLMYLSYLYGGLTGANILKATVLLLAFGFLFAAARNEAGDDDRGFLAALVVLLVLLFALRFRLFIRPYLFSFLFFSVFIYLLGRYGRSGNIRVLYWLPAVEILWANTSKAAFYGPLLFAIFLIGNSVELRKVDRRLLFVFGVTAGSGFLNPATYQVYLMPVLYALPLVSAAEKVRTTLGEHQPVTTELLWGYGLRYTFAYQILVVVSLWYLVFQRGWRRPYHLLLFFIFFLQSLSMVRMIDFFSLAAAVLSVLPLSRLVGMVLPQKPLPKMLFYAAFCLLILFMVPYTVLGSTTYSFGSGVKKNTFPEEAIAFLEKEGIKGRMFNSYALGGYLLWRAPARKVFIDGRGGPLYSNELLNAYSDAMKDREAWNTLDLSWHFDYAVLDYDMKDRRYPLHLNSNPEWAPVYWDSHSAVYLRKTPQNSEVLRKYEYRLAKPGFYDYTYLQSYLNKSSPQELIAQIDREIKHNPLNKEPLLAKAFLLYNLGKPYQAEVLNIIRASIKLNPPLAMEHSALGFFLADMGMTDKARQEMSAALLIDPFDPGALALRERLR